MKLILPTEADLTAFAGTCAARWRAAGLRNLVVGVAGDLGAGKTTWVRALLRSLGYAGRVPSPTYTLLEHYELEDLSVVHMDLYRLADPGELEYLGLRDWLALPNVWLFAEWPDRGGRWAETCDLQLELEIHPTGGRLLTLTGQTDRGRLALAALGDEGSK